MANTKQREKIRLAREAAFDKQIKTGAAATTVVGTAAYLMSGDAKIAPVNKPSAPSTSPVRTPVAPAPQKDFIDWRDRPSSADAREKPGSTSSSKSSISTSKSGSSSRKSVDSFAPSTRNSDVRGAFRKAGRGRVTAAQATKSRYLAGQAKREAKSATNIPKQTQSIAKPVEISKRYELTPKQAGDKLLQTANSLFPKSSPTIKKAVTPEVTPKKVGDARYTSTQREKLSKLDYVSPGLAKRERARLDALLKKSGK